MPAVAPCRSWCPSFLSLLHRPLPQPDKRRAYNVISITTIVGLLFYSLLITASVPPRSPPLPSLLHPSTTGATHEAFSFMCTTLYYVYVCPPPNPVPHNQCNSRQKRQPPVCARRPNMCVALHIHDAARGGRRALRSVIKERAGWRREGRLQGVKKKGRWRLDIHITMCPQSSAVPSRTCVSP